MTGRQSKRQPGAARPRSPPGQARDRVLREGELVLGQGAQHLCPQGSLIAPGDWVAPVPADGLYPKEKGSLTFL